MQRLCKSKSNYFWFNDCLFWLDSWGFFKIDANKYGCHFNRIKEKGISISAASNDWINVMGSQTEPYSAGSPDLPTMILMVLLP